MNQSYPVPPPELVQQCWDELRDQTQVLDAAKAWDKAIALAYRAGADQELEACCEVLTDKCFVGQATLLREWRRPKPPTLKEQALAILPERSSDASFLTVHFKDVDLLRRALEQLPDAL